MSVSCSLSRPNRTRKILCANLRLHRCALSSRCACVRASTSACCSVSIIFVPKAYFSRNVAHCKISRHHHVRVDVRITETSSERQLYAQELPMVSWLSLFQCQFSNLISLSVFLPRQNDCFRDGGQDISVLHLLLTYKQNKLELIMVPKLRELVVIIPPRTARRVRVAVAAGK